MCMHNVSLLKRCPSCERICQEMQARFERDVFFGKVNWRGYTENEWKASRHAGEPWR